jgi:chromosome segregation ATPase
MTTRDYAEAFEDDSENVRGWPAQDAQEPPEGLSESGFEDLCMQLMQELSAQTAKCERLSAGSEYLRNEIVNLKAERDEARTTLSEATAEIIRLNADDMEYTSHWPLP